MQDRVSVGAVTEAEGRCTRGLPAAEASAQWDAAGQALRTGRLLLRPWRDSDLEPFAALNADPQVMRFFPAVLQRHESDALAARLRQQFYSQGYGIWAVEVPGQAGFIGFVGLAEPRFDAPFTPCVELAWRLARDWWGQGLAPEAAAAVRDYAFGTLALKEVVAYTLRENHPSRRVMEKLGMTRDAAEDFDHPLLPVGHPMRRHVLYRLRARP
ncbi:RimJ/RimL family protein N-acetyltransferase [Kerstersia gyiorum]|uniref:GNAT family N-acetyltransferase n=1 Tax=Kerstersia gyiorum TaxID=206506 RepID=UPI002FCCDC31|nr:RimJ/RimL family protein N-acetyltransferase [Kerstersia gyiorum]